MVWCPDYITLGADNMGLRSLDADTEDVKNVNVPLGEVTCHSYRLFFIRTYSATGITGKASFARTLYSSSSLTGSSYEQAYGSFSLVP